MAPSSSRGGARVRWIVIHTAEGIRKASDLRAFFDRSTNSSSHAVADDATLLEGLVPYERASWTLRSGNPVSENMELCGFAAWTRDEWMTNHRGMLNNAATWIARRCLANGVPIRKLTPAEVSRDQAGVIGHHDYTVGKRDGSHWDPGPGFPWDYVIQLATQGHVQEEEEPPEEEQEDMNGIHLYPATDPEKPARFSLALPGRAADRGGLAGSYCRCTTGWGNTVRMRVWFLADGDKRYLGRDGGTGMTTNIVSDTPGFFPIPEGTTAIHVEWTSTKEEAGYLAVKFVPV